MGVKWWPASPANDILWAANDNPPEPHVRVEACHVQVVDGPIRIRVRVDASALLEWYYIMGRP